MKVGVFLQPWQDKVADFLERKGIPTFAVPKAPEELPEALKALIRQSGIKGAVLVEEGGEGEVAETLQEAGIPPYAFEAIQLPPGPLEGKTLEKARLLAFAAVEGVRAQGEVAPEHLKPTFVSVQEALSRRDLLFGFFKPRYEVIPAVEASRCTAWKGCRLCLDACPQAALSFREGRIVLDKAFCTGCGACLPACPQEAISSPRLAPQVLEAKLRALLSEEVPLRPRVLLITAKDRVPAGRGWLPPEILELLLPCTGALSAWLLLRALRLGADALFVLPCDPSCRHHCHGKGWERPFHFVQTLLPALGVPAARLQAIPGTLDPEAFIACLRTFVEEGEEMGPHRLQEAGAADGSFRLVDLLQDLSTRFGVEQVILKGDHVPFGLIKLEKSGRACTLCGACPDRCPTGALLFQEHAQTSTLLFDHASCIACFACVEACPEKVLTGERALALGLLRKGPVPLAEDRIVSCQRCGRPIAPSRMLQRVQHLLSPQPLDPKPQPLDFFEVCPPCRITADLAKGQE